MAKELKCYSCGRTFNKYDAEYSLGGTCCPYCRSSNVDVNISEKDDKKDKKNKKQSSGLFSIFK